MNVRHEGMKSVLAVLLIASLGMADEAVKNDIRAKAHLTQRNGKPLPESLATGSQVSISVKNGQSVIGPGPWAVKWSVVEPQGLAYEVVDDGGAIVVATGRRAANLRVEVAVAYENSVDLTLYTVSIEDEDGPPAPDPGPGPGPTPGPSPSVDDLGEEATWVFEAVNKHLSVAQYQGFVKAFGDNFTAIAGATSQAVAGNAKYADYLNVKFIEAQTKKINRESLDKAGGDRTVFIPFFTALNAWLDGLKKDNSLVEPSDYIEIWTATGEGLRAAAAK